jgi:hypothetical protein
VNVRFVIVVIITLLSSIHISCGSVDRRIQIGSAFDETGSPTLENLKTGLDRGTQYLIDAQNKDGSWGSFEFPYEIISLGTISSYDAFRNATTALCCMALMDLPIAPVGQAGVNGYDAARRTALNKGIRFLMAQPPECRATADILYHVWALAYVPQCFSRAIRYESLDIPKEELIVSARKWLRMLHRIQATDGGWGYYDFGYGYRKPAGNYSTSFTTGAVLCALWDAEKSGLEVDPSVRKAGLKCLKRLRTPEKSYAYGTYCQLNPEWSPNRFKGALGRVQPCNLMLFRHRDEVTISDLKLGLDRFFNEHHFIEMGKYRPTPHESWYATSGYYFFFGHFYASSVISELPVKEQRPYWNALVKTVLTCQESDGSWWDYPLYNYYKAYGTAYALLSLSPAYRMLVVEAPK